MVHTTVEPYLTRLVCCVLCAVWLCLQLVTCDSPAGRLGLTVCYDLRFPEVYQTLTWGMGAEVLLVPSAFTKVTGGKLSECEVALYSMDMLSLSSGTHARCVCQLYRCARLTPQAAGSWLQHGGLVYQTSAVIRFLSYLLCRLTWLMNGTPAHKQPPVFAGPTHLLLLSRCVHTDLQAEPTGRYCCVHAPLSASAT